MKVAPLLLLTVTTLAFAACENRYADSPARWKIRGPVAQVMPTPAPGNPYEPPAEVAKVPAADEVQ